MYLTFKKNVFRQPIHLVSKPCVYLKRLKTQKYLFDHYLHFLKLHIIKNYIYSLFIWSRRFPLRPHVGVGMGVTFIEYMYTNSDSITYYFKNLDYFY